MAGNRAAQRGLMLVALAWAMLCASARAAPIVIPDPGTRVVDTAHLLDAGTTSELDNLLARLEATTGAQVKVLTVPTTGDEDIFSFAQRQYQLWKLGSKDKNDGALIVLAPKDRKVRIHTGYGLEGSLPDSWIGSLSREIAAQYFKPGDYPGGLRAMTIAVVNKVADDAGKPLAGAPNIRHVAQPEQSTAGMILGILVLMLIIYLMYRASQNQRLGGRRAGPGWFGGFGGFGGGFSGGSFGGGSFGGGSFGGSFGGGGSSGGGGGGASW